MIPDNEIALNDYVYFKFPTLLYLHMFDLNMFLYIIIMIILHFNKSIKDLLLSKHN